MKIKLIALFFVTLFLAAQTVKADSKALLRLKLKKGSAYEMTMVSDNKIDQEMNGKPMKILQKIEMVIFYQVLDVLPKNIFEIEYSFQKMKMSMNVNGQQMNMDSDSTSDDPMSAVLKDLFALKIKVKMNSKGQILEIGGMEEYAQKMSANPQLAQSMKMFVDEKNFKTFVEQTFSYFPEDKVKVGSKWNNSTKIPSLMNLDIAMNYEVANILKDKIILNVTSDVNMESPVEENGMKLYVKIAGTQAGTMAISRSDCFASSSELTMNYDFKMKMKNPQSGEEMEIPMVLHSNITTNIIKK